MSLFCVFAKMWPDYISSPLCYMLLLHLVAPDSPEAASLIGGDVVEVTSKGLIEGIFSF